MIRWRPRKFRVRFWSQLAPGWALLLVWLAANPFTGCEGGSTGVDNPGLTSLPVDFEDPHGQSLAVNGKLEVYARTHNPAVDSQPLLRVQIERASEIALLPEDFARIGTGTIREVGGLTKQAIWARASSGSSPTESDGLIHFNLVFRSESKTGTTRAGFTFDPVSKRFGRDDDTSRTQVILRPEALVRFASSLDVNPIKQAEGRIILPGTPFQGVLMDSTFALEDVPVGEFSAQYVAGDGRVFALRETLNTQGAPTTFTADPQPIGQITTDIAPSGFGVSLGEMQSVTVHDTIPLQAKMLAADPEDPRLAVVWRVIPENSKGPAMILNPANWLAAIVFAEPGNYQIELSATLGLTTQRDTLDFKVNGPLAVEAGKFLNPLPDEKIAQGSIYKVVWESKATGLMRLEWIPKDGASLEWHAVADSIQVGQGTGTQAWTIPMLDSLSVPCLMRLRRVASDSIITQLSGVIYLTR